MNYIIQACQAIEYAHSQGILHKDINPKNLMVLENGKVKLVDFGLACSINDDDELFDGAFPYLAPELVDGEPASLRSEVYALGVSAFEMVAGHHPYPDSDSAMFVRARATQEIPDPADSVPEIPRSLRKFIIKACKRDPEKRYSTIKEAIQELKYQEGGK